jgi:general secretion pathway protein M
VTILPRRHAGRAAAATILFVLLAVIYVAAVQPLIDDYVGTSDSIDRMSALLERYRRLAQSLPTLEARLARLKQQPASQDGFFQAASDAQLAAQLQGRVRAVVEAAHGELKSTQVLPTQEDGKTRRVAVRGQVASNLAQMQRVLYDLEAASPYLFIDNLNIRARGADRRTGSVELDPILDVRFDVYAYMLASQ